MLRIDKILSAGARGVLTLVGGGGKTSIMFHLAHLLVQSGKRVLTTTTTRIFIPEAEQSEIVLVNADPANILTQGAKYVAATAGHSVSHGKLIGFAPEVINMFADSGVFDWVIVEGDGSARRPLKAPAGHEPVIPAATTILVAVVGLDVLGKPLCEEQVFRSELAGKLMGLSAGELITESALVKLAAHPEGLFKYAPPLASRFIFLNKADDQVRCESAARIAAQLRKMAIPPVETVIVGQALDRIRVHAVYHQAESL